MILCLAAAHKSIFLTRSATAPCPFFVKSAYEAIFVSFVSLYQQTFLATFYLILLHLSIQILKLEIHSLKPLRYTCECSN